MDGATWDLLADLGDSQALPQAATLLQVRLARSPHSRAQSHCLPGGSCLQTASAGRSPTGFGAGFSQAPCGHPEGTLQAQKFPGSRAFGGFLADSSLLGVLVRLRLSGISGPWWLCYRGSRWGELMEGSVMRCILRIWFCVHVTFCYRFSCFFPFQSSILDSLLFHSVLSSWLSEPRLPCGAAGARAGHGSQ